MPKNPHSSLSHFFLRGDPGGILDVRKCHCRPLFLRLGFMMEMGAGRGGGKMENKYGFMIMKSSMDVHSIPGNCFLKPFTFFGPFLLH